MDQQNPIEYNFGAAPMPEPVNKKPKVLVLAIIVAVVLIAITGGVYAAVRLSHKQSDEPVVTEPINNGGSGGSESGSTEDMLSADALLQKFKEVYASEEEFFVTQDYTVYDMIMTAVNNLDSQYVSMCNGIENAPLVSYELLNQSLHARTAPNSTLDQDTIKGELNEYESLYELGLYAVDVLDDGVKISGPCDSSRATSPVVRYYYSTMGVEDVTYKGVNTDTEAAPGYGNYELSVKIAFPTFKCDGGIEYEGGISRCDVTLTDLYKDYTRTELVAGNLDTAGLANIDWTQYDTYKVKFVMEDYKVYFSGVEKEAENE